MMNVYLAEAGGYEESEILGIFSTEEKAIESLLAAYPWIQQAEGERGDDRVLHRWAHPSCDRPDEGPPLYFWATVTLYEVDKDGEP